MSRIVPGREKEWKFYQNRVANFLKHADRDPNETITNVDLKELNELELLLCILAYWQLAGKTTNGLSLGLLYCGLHNESWFEIGLILKEAGLPVDQIEHYRQMPRREQRTILLDAFDVAYPAK